MLKNAKILLMGVLLMYLNCGEKPVNLKKLRLDIQELISIELYLFIPLEKNNPISHISLLSIVG
jgi:hypothetical protein